MAEESKIEWVREQGLPEESSPNVSSEGEVTSTPILQTADTPNRGIENLNIDKIQEVRVGQGSAVMRVNKQGLWLGNEVFSSAPFRVSMAGALTATSFSLNGSTLSNQDIFGDGSDGNVTISVNTTLSSDMYYNNLTVNTGIVLNASGYRIFCKGTLTTNGTGKIKNNGANGGNGNDGGNGANPGSGGGAGGAASGNSVSRSSASSAGHAGGSGNSVQPAAASAGTVATVAIGVAGAAGGTGGTGGGGNPGGDAGSGGAISSTPFNIIRNFSAAYFLIDNQPSPTSMGVSGGSGGGGGGRSGSDGSGTSGAGGGGGGAGGAGGVLFISANTITHAGTFEAIGGNAGNGGIGGNGVGGTSTGGGGGGGGGGGSGGVVILIYGTKTGAGTTSVAGGSGGTGGAGGTGPNGSGGTGVNGTAGNTGKTISLIV